MPIPESHVLKPTDPALDEVKWAEFVLSDASIVYESNGKPASLLSAYEDTALRVQGRLETPPRHYSHYRTFGMQDVTESIVWKQDALLTMWQFSKNLINLLRL